MAEEPLSVTIEDDQTVVVDPETGTIETLQPDGGVVVNLDARRPKKDEDDDQGFYQNLVEKVAKTDLDTICNELIEQITADDNSRQEHLQIRARGLNLLGLKLEDPKSSVQTSGVDGMSVVTNPLLLEAVLKGWANAQAELLPAQGPAKIEEMGSGDVPDELAETLERDFNYWIRKVAKEYYPDTSYMLLWGTYFGGSGFKKVYRCPMKRRPTSVSVDEKDLIVSDATKDLSSCARITHQILMRPAVMKRMEFIGAYKRDSGDANVAPTPNAVDQTVAGIQGVSANTETMPDHEPFTLWETQCELDLDDFAPKKFKGEGIPLPYLVTIDKNNQEIIAIRRDWKEDDEECLRKTMYIKYPYVPGPGFYGTGLLNILGNSSAAMTAAWREALDAGMYASFPGGLIAKSASRQNSSNFRMGPGEFAQIDTGGMPIQQAVMPMPYRDVTGGLMTMMDKITSQAKETGGTADLPVGEGVQNVPVGTMLAAIEQATKVMAAAHKGMHTAQSDELQLILDLFRENPEDFWRGLRPKERGYWNEAKFMAALEAVPLVPVSDPNVPSHIHRVGKATALVQLQQLYPAIVDDRETVTRALIAIREDPMGLVKEEQAGAPPPDPKAIADLMKAKTAQDKLGLDAQKLKVTADDIQEKRVAKREELIGRQQIEQQKNVREHIKDQADNQREDKRLGLEAAKLHVDAATNMAGKAEGGAVEGPDPVAVMKTAHEVERGNRQEDREDERFEHEKQLGVASHNLDVWTAKHPPKPAAKPKPKGKK